MSQNKQKIKQEENLVNVPVSLDNSLICSTVAAPQTINQAQLVQVVNGVITENDTQNGLIYIILPTNPNGNVTPTQNDVQAVLTPFIIPKNDTGALQLQIQEVPPLKPVETKPKISTSPPQKVKEVRPVNKAQPGSRMLSCEFPGCGMTFPSLYHKNKHADSHAFVASKEFKCSICNMVFPEATERNKHIETHTVVNTYKCNGCQAVFPYYTSYIKHIEDYKCTAKKPFLCHICQNRFVEGKTFLKHLHSHSQSICKCKYVGRHNSVCKALTKKIKDQIRTMKRKLHDVDDDED